MKGMKARTPKRLNKKWDIATLFPIFPIVREAIITVEVVPILAPKMNPIAWFKPIYPPPTRTNTIPETTLLDWNRIEEINPTKIATNKLDVTERYDPNNCWSIYDTKTDIR